VDLNKYQHTETVTVGAAPDAVYDMVADVTRMGEWSPVCSACDWQDAEHKWFLGTNTTPERTWQTKCRVDVADRGREFTFTNCGFEGDAELVRWTYRMAPEGGGTALTEEWEVLPGYEANLNKLAPGLDVEQYLDGVLPVTRAGMADTLNRLKQIAES